MSYTRTGRRISHTLLAACVLGMMTPTLVPAARAVAAPVPAGGDVHALSPEKVVPSDIQEDDHFGCSIATNGDLAIIGADWGQKDDTMAGQNTGCAYTYMRLGDAWESVGKLVAFDGATNDRFGTAVAIWGDTAVVTAPETQVGGLLNAGAAYIFTWTGTTWSFQQKVVSPDHIAEQMFGASVALCQDTLIVGAQNSGATLGGAYVFTRSGSTWTPQANLVSLASPDVSVGDWFGYEVALYRDTAVVGVPGDDDKASPDAGAAYVFVRGGSTWSKQAKLTATDGAAKDYFGSAVAVERDTILVGAYMDDDRSTADAGAVYSFTRVGTTWTQSQKLLAEEYAAWDEFGLDVSLSGDTAVVGVPMGGLVDQGAVCAFARVGGSWIEYPSPLTDPEGELGDEFGHSVSVCGGRFAFGAWKDDDGLDPDAGSAYLYATGSGHPYGMRRIAGSNRYQTAVQVSKAGHPVGASAVVIATGENWPDALGGSPLAGAVRGPILLVRRGALPDEVRAEIVRLGARKAYILGSTASVSGAVEASLVSLLGRSDVVRLGGADRYETDRLIIKETIKRLGPVWGGLCIVATGANYPDALAVSPFAALRGVPIILVNPRSTTVKAPSGTQEIAIVGSTAAVSQAIENAYAALPGVTTVSRMGGANRYATAALVANRCVLQGGMRWTTMGLATGENFPDALAAGPMQALLGSVLLLTRQATLPAETQAKIAANAAEIDRMTIFGSTAAVSARVEAEAKATAGITP